MEEDRINRFWSRVDIKSKDECWNWKRGKTSYGYGSFNTGGENHYTHRISWELSNNSKIPKGKDICHRCDNPSCCNPDHLYCGTRSDNNNDRANRNPLNQGTNEKLREGEIWLIRKLHIHTMYGRHKFSCRFVARMFKISRSTILNIWNSEAWLCREGQYV